MKERAEGSEEEEEKNDFKNTATGGNEKGRIKKKMKTNVYLKKKIGEKYGKTKRREKTDSIY